MLGNDRKILIRSLEKQILTVGLQNCEKSVVKHFIINLCYLISLICLQHFVQGCLRKHIFISNSIQRPWNFHFWYVLVFQSAHLLFKLIFRANDLPQSRKFYIFQEALVFTLVSSTYLLLKVIVMEAEQYLCKGFRKTDRFGSFRTFPKKLKL